jgi:hypothetical protein
VAGHGHERDRRAADLTGHLGQEPADSSYRSHDRRQEGAWQPHALEQPPIPVTICNTQELRGRGDGGLGRRLPSQKEAKEIRDQEERRRTLEQLGPRLA